MGSALRAAIAVFALAQPTASDVLAPPFPRTYPGDRLIETIRVDQPLELKAATADAEAVIAGQSYVQLTFDGSQSAFAPVATELQWYRDTLFAAGWKLIDAANVTPPVDARHVSISAHFRNDGRNIYTRITHESRSRHIVNIADVGAEDWAARLARDCRVRIHSIHFAHDRPIIQELESEPTLRKLADLIKSRNTPAVRIEGHMDNIGEEGRAEREQLSLGRARMVVDWLTKEGGVPADKVSAHGMDRKQPIADNDTDLGRALNRRIEVARTGCFGIVKE
jgi:outer membrane protein OmpA-like peptidoglycan-associated protein